MKIYRFDDYIHAAMQDDQAQMFLRLSGIVVHYEKGWPHATDHRNQLEQLVDSSCGHVMQDQKIQMYLSLTGAITNYRIDAWEVWPPEIGLADCDYRVTWLDIKVKSVMSMDLNPELIDMLDQLAGGEPVKWLYEHLRQAGLA